MAGTTSKWNIEAVSTTCDIEVEMKMLKFSNIGSVYFKCFDSSIYVIWKQIYSYGRFKIYLLLSETGCGIYFHLRTFQVQLQFFHEKKCLSSLSFQLFSTSNPCNGKKSLKILRRPTCKCIINCIDPKILPSLFSLSQSPLSLYHTHYFSIIVLIL